MVLVSIMVSVLLLQLHVISALQLHQELVTSPVLTLDVSEPCHEIVGFFLSLQSRQLGHDLPCTGLQFSSSSAQGQSALGALKGNSIVTSHHSHHC